MREVVRAAWHGFSEPLEGRCTWMYADALGLVTTGVGNLIDPIAYALALPWRTPDGKLATPEDIRRAWQRVKRDADPKAGGGTHARLTSLRLDDHEVDRLVDRKLDANDRVLETRFPAWHSLPADAQLALHSLAWACGPHFKYPKLEAAVKRLDFVTAAEECRITPLIGTIIERNSRNRRCLLNAAAVVAADMDPGVLHWPATVTMPEEVA